MKGRGVKKVLIITYMPYASPRVPALAKYLPEFGWQVVIMTPPYHRESGSESIIIETPYKDSLRLLKKLFGIKADENDLRQGVKERLGISSRNLLLDSMLTIGSAIVNYPDSERGWKTFAIKAGENLLRQEDIDAMISSSSPITSHLIANELKSRHRIPWVADLRDLWSQNHNYSYGPLRRLVDRRLELKTLATADALSTVSQPWADKLSMLHRGKTTYVITNSFDPDRINKPPHELIPKFTITYTGTIYAGKQNPTKFFTALGELVSEGSMNPSEVEVRFYGSVMGWLDKEIRRYELSSIVRQYGRVPVQIAQEKQRESQLLLLLDWDDPRGKGVFPGKVFEYLAARRPILVTGGVDNDVVHHLMDETVAGTHAPTVPEIKRTLSEFYGEYKLKGKVVYHGDESIINKYSHREMARRFSEILDRLVCLKC